MSSLSYLASASAVFLLSLVFTGLVRKIAIKNQIIDAVGGARKIHQKPTPLLGGLGIFLAFFTALFIFSKYLTAGNLEIRHWLGFAVGGLILMIGGFLDDKYDLKPKQQIIAPLLAVLAVIIGGVAIEKVTNPWGGFLFLQSISALLIFVWLMGMMYTTKLLDGVDGLVGGVTTVGALVIFLFTMTTRYHQPDVGLAALFLAAAVLGFLVWNWHPAKIFLGEGGSIFLGYALGVLAIISGGKIAIALLVMGIPILDVIWTIVRRLRAGKNPFKFSDRQHLHHRLLDLGLSPRQTSLFYILISSIFGLAGLFFQSHGKILLLGFLVLLMFSLVVFLNRKKSSNC